MGGRPVGRISKEVRQDNSSFGFMKINRTIIVAISIAAAGIIAVLAIAPHSEAPVRRTATALPESAHKAVALGQVIPIDVVVLKRLMTSDPNLVIIDVRKAAELTGPLGSIPQSLNIPAKQLISTLDRLPRGKSLVFICHSGPRSLQVARKAAALGLTSYYVKGGMVAWRRMMRHNGKEHSPAPPPSSVPQKTPEETPFFGRDMGC